MHMKITLSLIIITLVLTLSSCTFSLPEVREINVDSTMQDVADKYKTLLEADVFQVSTACTRFDTIDTHKVIISVLNPRKVLGADSLNTIARKIADDTFVKIINKSDFQIMEIVFVNQKGNALANFQTKRNYVYKFSELENKVDSLSH
jgi:hypothetical protein